MLHYAKTSKLTENSIQYKTVKLYNLFKEIGLWPVGIDQEQFKMLHRFYRDILNLYLNNHNDMLAFFTSTALFLLNDQLIFSFNE